MLNYFIEIWKYYRLYCGEGMTLALFFMALLYVYVKRGCTTLGKPFGLYSLFSVILFFLPVTAWALFPLLDDGMVYWRVLWTVPLVFVTAYAFAHFIAETPDNIKKFLQTGVIIAIIALCGKFIYTAENYDRAYNAYKLPPVAIEISEAVKSAVPSPNIAVPAEIVPYIRQYDADIKMAYGRLGRGNTDNNDLKDSIYKLMAGEEMLRSIEDAKNFSAMLKNAGVDLIVLRPDMPVYKYKDELGKLIGTVGIYEIYGINN